MSRQPEDTIVTPCPTELTPGRRIRLFATGLIPIHTGLVLDEVDRYGWRVVKVDGPEDSPMFGVKLRCEDYVPIEYINEPQEEAA